MDHFFYFLFKFTTPAIQKIFDVLQECDDKEYLKISPEYLKKAVKNINNI